MHRRGARQGTDDRHGADRGPRQRASRPRRCASAVLTRAFHNGLLLLSCGVSTVRFMPPLMVSREQVDEALVLLKSALREALAES